MVGGGGQHWGEGGQRGLGRVMVRLSASSEDEEDDLPALIPDFHDEEDTGQFNSVNMHQPIYSDGSFFIRLHFLRAGRLYRGV